MAPLWGSKSHQSNPNDGAVEDLEYGSMNDGAPAEIAEVPQQPTLNPAEVRVRKKLERICYWMDDCMTIPGTNRRIGLDPIVGLLPWVGDMSSAASESLQKIFPWCLSH